ncbi:extracellular alpha-1 4-glucan glucosidase [Fusarium sp. NRRL 52700]|nr:extracellular alpha-1 4-glucan glucosidase [Fusarium sp. NRRL 52700]
MTTEICVKLAVGSIYVGVYGQTCYKADSLVGSEIVQDERCSLPCPGDPSLFCGGTTGGAGRRRAIPSNRLLTLYRQAVSSSSFFSSSSSPSSSSPSSLSPSQSSQASVTRTLSSTSKSNAATTYTPPVSSSSISSRKTTVSPVISELSSISGTPSPITPGPVRTIHVTKGVTVTEIVIAATVTTVTYVTLNPSQPGALTTSCITLTLEYTACGCDHQEYPPVDMTTIISPCKACGYQGQDIVTMVVPVAACETGSVGYESSGWYDGHQIQPGHGVDVGSQPQPTQGQQNGNGPGYTSGHGNENGPGNDNGPGYEIGPSNIAVVTQGSGDKAQGSQPANPLPEQGQQNGNGPNDENGPSNVAAATQGSGGKAQGKQPVNPLPTQGQKNGSGPNDKNGPSHTEAGAHGSGGEAQNKQSPSPLPAQGQHNTDQPGHENDQPYATAQPSPEHNNKKGPIASESRSSNALNPSKPSPLPQGEQLSSGGPTLETSVIPGPGLGTVTSPSQSVPGEGHRPAISTTLATEVEATTGTKASESTHSLSPLESGETSSSPSKVPSSEANRHPIMYWSMIVVIVGMVLAL